MGIRAILFFSVLLFAVFALMAPLRRRGTARRRAGR